MSYQTGVTPARRVLANRARELRKQGLTQREVGHALGISRTYAAALLTDPDGTAARARKDSYSGVCVNCGRPTTGSDGPRLAPERCAHCAVIKHWNREAIIAAIKRFAQVNGRPPIASEWIRADPANGYPACTSTYRSTPKSTSPFAKWSEALAAAGFPGITSGRRTYKEVRTMEYDRKGYVVLHEVDGHWDVVAESDEGTPVGALNAVLNGSDTEGRWMAIPGRYWRPRELRPRTILDWAEDTESIPVV